MMGGNGLDQERNKQQGLQRGGFSMEHDMRWRIQSGWIVT